jgi:hypothetical protein
MFDKRAGFIALFFWFFCGLGQAAEVPKEIAVGEWSQPVVDKDGYALRGRLVVCEKPRTDDTREAVVYIELQDASEFVGQDKLLYCELTKTDFRPEYKGGLRCEMRDKDGQLVKPKSFPFGGGAPRSQWVKLPPDATIRLRSSPFGVRRQGALAIVPDLNTLWAIADDDRNEYFLSGTFTIGPGAFQMPLGEGRVWRGTIDLPAARITSQRK